ncbi:MAG: transglutaminase-like domain-containing protein [Myxococcota bacterium]
MLSVVPPGEPPRAIGTEQRYTATKDGRTTVVRRRTTWLRLGGERTAVRGASRVEGASAGPVDTYVQWSPTHARTWAGSAWVPDVWAPPETGRWPIVDPFGFEVISALVTVEGDHAVWTSSGGEARAVYDTQGLVRATQGVFVLERGSPSGPLSDFDPVLLYAIPTAVQPRAARSLVGRFLVDGRVVRIDAPIWAQIPRVSLPPHGPSEAADLVADAPNARRAVQELVAHVHRTLDGQPQPGTLAAVDALRQGRGDCDEAAASFVSLARAVGLEADLVGGLVYREGVVGPGLYPHAWATVRLGGTTVAVDPALGQAPADASHVPLGSSAAEAAARLSRGVRIAVVELR